jgi:glycosyltransferase involved in cell wall biosynthesis
MNEAVLAHVNRKPPQGPPRPAPRIAERAAIAHDWFQGFHGSERVVEAIRSDVFAPDYPPDVFTFHASRELLPPGLADAIVRESRLASLPGIRQRGHDSGRWRYLLPLMPFYFRNLALQDYDVVVASSHACAVNARPRDDALFVCYSHTPMRYAWMPETDQRHPRGPKAALLSAMTARLRTLDRDASRRPDSFVANSQAVRERIQAFYGRDAIVIHPPVAVEDFTPLPRSEPITFLWVHRLVPYKHPHLVVESFRGLPYRLIMVGVGPLETTLRRTLPDNVELHGWLPRERLACLYSEAAGFVHVAEEDFGMSMVEALAAGTPVIGLDRGGARDIVRPGVDGVLIEQPDVALLRDAVQHVATREWSHERLAERAWDFSRERFSERFAAHLVSLGAKAA